MTFYRQPPRGPYGSGVRLGVPSLTPVVKVILFTCLGVWIVQFLAQALFERNYLSALFGVVPQYVFFKGFIWQPVTYMFLHDPVSPFHILFNMLILWMIGGELERHWGSRPFLRYYLVCGIGAGVIVAIQGVLASKPPIPTIGASGAIYGLILAYGMIFSERILLFMFVFPMRARTMAIVLFAMAFFNSLGQRQSLISHIAHLGGMVIGYLYLKRAWRLGDFYRELRWKYQRRKFKVMQRGNDEDRWVN